MKKLYQISVVTLVICLFFSFTSYGVEQALRYEDEADQLKAVSLFVGTTQGYELDREPTRLEALVMLIRLLGLEEEAKATTDKPPFIDVPEWGVSYVAFAYENGLTKGLSDTTFGSSQYVSEAMFTTFVLRALGYDDLQGDFLWIEALEKGQEIGLLPDEYNEGKSDVFLRDDCVGIAHQALFVKLKNQEFTLLEDLISKSVISEEEAKNIFLSQEPEEPMVEVVAYAPVSLDLNLATYIGITADEAYDELKELYGEDIKITESENGAIYISIMNNGNQEVAFHTDTQHERVIFNTWLGFNSHGSATDYGVDVSSRLEQINGIRVSQSVEGVMNDLSITRDDFNTERLITNSFQGVTFNVRGYSWETSEGIYTIEVIDDFSAIFGFRLFKL